MMARPRITCLMMPLTLGFLIGGWFGCTTTPSEPEFDNPIIPDDPTYEPPSVQFTIAPKVGATLDTCYVLLAWKGNQPRMEFTYQLDEAVWSDWLADTSVVYPYLDEGMHTFQLRCRYISGVKGFRIKSVHFTIDAIHGPALRLFPRYQEVASGDTFSVEVMLEEVENVFAVKAVLEFDPATLQVTNVEVYEDGRSLLEDNGGTVIPFSRYDNTAGAVTIEVATAKGNPPGVDDTGPIVKVTFNANGIGSSLISLATSSALRDPDNVDIALNELAEAKVEVR